MLLRYHQHSTVPVFFFELRLHNASFLIAIYVLNLIYHVSYILLTSPSILFLAFDIREWGFNIWGPELLRGYKSPSCLNIGLITIVMVIMIVQTVLFAQLYQNSSQVLILSWKRIRASAISFFLLDQFVGKWYMGN